MIPLGCICILCSSACFRKLMWELLFASLTSQGRTIHLPLLKCSTSGSKFFRQEHNRRNRSVLPVNHTYFFPISLGNSHQSLYPLTDAPFCTSILCGLEDIKHVTGVSFQRWSLLVMQSWGICGEWWRVGWEKPEVDFFLPNHVM